MPLSPTFSDAVDSLKTTDDCLEAFAMIKARHTDLQRRVAVQLKVGQKVQWNSRKKGGRTLIGTITGINPKSVSVVEDGGARWTITPSLLKVVA